MTPIEKAAAYVVEIARQEVGYREKASNSQLDDKTANAGSNNYTKYAAYFDRLWNSGIKWYNTRKQGADWCDMFFDWCQCQAWGWETALKVVYQTMESCGAGCKFSADYYRANGAWISRSGEPKIGDQIFFGSVGDESHTGMVVGVDANNVYTVEGNASNRCMEKPYARGNANIAGYGRPDYALVAYQFVDPPTPDTPIVDDSEAVTMQDLEEILEKRLGPQIETISDVPHKSVAAITRTLLDLQAVDGGTPYSVNPDDIHLPYNVLRAIVICVRYVDKRLQEMEGGKDG